MGTVDFFYAMLYPLDPLISMIFWLKFVDFRMGEESGYIRFEDSDSAVKARATAVLVESGLTVKNCTVTLEALTGMLPNMLLVTCIYFFVWDLYKYLPFICYFRSRIMILIALFAMTIHM